MRGTAMEAWGPRRRPDMHTTLEAAGKAPTREKAGIAEANVQPAGRRLEAPLVGAPAPGRHR